MFCNPKKKSGLVSHLKCRNLVMSGWLSARDDSPLIYINPLLVPTWVEQYRFSMSFTVALEAFLVYDTFINMDKEVKYFWSSPLKLVSLVYFANRYIGISQLVTGMLGVTFSANNAMCMPPYSSFGINVLLFITIDYILLMRVLALYSQDKKLNIILHILWLLEAVSEVSILIVGTLRTEYVVRGLAKGMTVCVQRGQLSVIFPLFGWSIIMIYAFILMCLALYRATSYWNASRGFKGMALLKVVIRDQVLYFILVMICCAFQIMQNMLYLPNPAIATIINLVGSPTFVCVLGCRMLVHLKEAGEIGVNEGTSYRSDQISTMEFTYV
ncbi:hypothetical protein PNOK_0422100 [Pyrrhoderma noxium]|uniref:DUF6533 domain-containing protein n=1 Tax=Pyrrhoderma noxium TaxID=2282107 RepID=A0A286UIB6_9AGAM|nr:hypothetical protein PNOK_0422100 [Pyrrhoderma noxium]